MSQQRELEQERRLNLLDRRLRLAEDRIKDLMQSLPRAFGSGGEGSGADPHYFLARSDGAAQATGTFPSITPATFTSDVLDIAVNEVAETEASVEWWYTDALTTSGALVWCVKKPDGTFVGVVEQCTAIALDV